MDQGRLKRPMRAMGSCMHVRKVHSCWVACQHVQIQLPWNRWQWRERSQLLGARKRLSVGARHMGHI